MHKSHRSRAGIKYQQTWTFYLRRLFLFARLSYYFIAVLRLTKSSTLLSTPVLSSTQQVSIWSLKMLLIYFSQNGHFWNGVGSANNISQSHPQESTEQSTGSCDKKCSGSVSGFHLAGETHSYTLDFVVKKGRVTLKDLTVVSHTTTTTTPISPSTEPGGG